MSSFCCLAAILYPRSPGSYQKPRICAKGLLCKQACLSYIWLIICCRLYYLSQQSCQTLCFIIHILPVSQSPAPNLYPSFTRSLYS
ncbi:hypothetical protein XELAEV_18025700mg [Xenopus laevis]|uniref:Uncharacterized protein n=1 Tax=Xenopus laevis TaxID=8355 RepID=A0A974HM29_XENLA|nr:hypothetical protein XELAEV_18025700mg [Xenopus laevis]